MKQNKDSDVVKEALDKQIIQEILNEATKIPEPQTEEEYQNIIKLLQNRQEKEFGEAWRKAVMNALIEENSK